MEKAKEVQALQAKLAEASAAAERSRAEVRSLHADVRGLIERGEYRDKELERRDSAAAALQVTTAVPSGPLFACLLG